MRSLKSIKKDWNDAKIEAARAKKKEAELVEEILERCSESSGTEKLEDGDVLIQVKHRMNVKYPDKDSLEDLIVKMPEGLDLFRVDYKERTAQVLKYLDQKGQHASELKNLRVETPGKPEIKVVR